MCLFIDKQLTEKRLEAFKRKGIKEIVVWKVVYTNEHKSPCNSYKYKLGKNIPGKAYKKIF